MRFTNLEREAGSRGGAKTYERRGSERVAVLQAGDIAAD